MSDNNLSTAIDGTVVQASDVNQFKTALGGDVVPRTIAGEPTDSAGSIGTSIYPWLRSWIYTAHVAVKQIFGAVDETNPDIKDDGSQNLQLNTYNSKTHDFKIDGTTKAKIETTGIDATYLKALSITGAKIANETITGTQIQNASIGEGELASSAVTTLKVATGAITQTRIGASAIGYTELKGKTYTAAATVSSFSDQFYYASGLTASTTGGSNFASVDYTVKGGLLIVSAYWDNGAPLSDTSLRCKVCRTGLNPTGVIMTGTTGPFQVMPPGNLGAIDVGYGAFAYTDVSMQPGQTLRVTVERAAGFTTNNLTVIINEVF